MRAKAGEPVVSKPELVTSTKPLYTERAKKARVMGTVILETVIGTNGGVSQAKVLKGLPYGLSAASIDSVCDWRFQPATMEGAPIEVYYVLTVNYQFDDKPAQVQTAQPGAR